MKVTSLRIRASYPNFYMVNLYAREGREIFNHDNEDPLNQLEGNKPGTVIYRLEGEQDGSWSFLRRSPLSRALKMWEDRITLTPSAAGLEAEGLTRDLVRVVSGLDTIQQQDV